ncbi:MAG: DUF4145 domain-containing protein [Candidatus Hydrogenedentes bacterium]|nr:DUF4145 domain-containing protein [Candidatus Hydrogenedentota bacterium]
MYIDARKCDYENLGMSASDSATWRDRDKEFTKCLYSQWFAESLDEIITRLWEIDDIGVVEQTGEFVRLLKEAEFTYSVGAYQSAIALIGVCAEDLCRFIAANSGKSYDKLRQKDRIDKLQDDGLITAELSDKFHVIRRLRNDCLHFNNCFKAKADADLRTDALEAINTLKMLYALIVGAIDYKTVDLAKLSDVLEALVDASINVSDSAVKGGNDVRNRLRNIFAAAFGIDLSLTSSKTKSSVISLFVIDEIDLDIIPQEATLKDIVGKGALYVDLQESDIAYMAAQHIEEGDTILACVESESDDLGMTSKWTFSRNFKVRKITS